MRLFTLFFILLALPCLSAPSLKERIDSIPSGDRNTIERLFRHLIWNEQFAYTLFGSKPMTRTSIHRSCQFYGLIQPCLQALLWSDWKVWERYQHLFPSQSFALFSQSDGDWFEISLFNKTIVEKVIEKNLTLFQEKLVSKDQPKILLGNLLASRNIWKEGVNKSQALIGILFGYGFENAKSFENYYTTTLKFFLPPPTSSQSEPMLYLLPLPFFSSFSESETAQLQQNYAQERAAILDRYAQGNFLEITLEQLSR